MGIYERLLIDNNHLNIDDTYRLPGNFKGIYDNGVILIDKELPQRQKLEVLCEELAHYKITYGDITDQKILMNRKFELKARRHGCEKLITLDGIISACESGVHNLYTLANYFEVTESYVIDTLEHYKMKHGLSTQHGKYVISFEPLRVFEYINLDKGEM